MGDRQQGGAKGPEVLAATPRNSPRWSPLGPPLATQTPRCEMYRLTGAFPESLLTPGGTWIRKDRQETEDGQEGAQAFREKRRPVWKLR